MNGLLGQALWLWDVLLPLGLAAAAYLGWLAAVTVRGALRAGARRAGPYVRRRRAARRTRRALGALVDLPEWAARRGGVTATGLASTGSVGQPSVVHGRHLSTVDPRANGTLAMTKRAAIITVLSVAAAAAIVAAVSVYLVVRSPTPAAARPAVVASTTPSPVPSGSPITRKAAAKQYLALVKHSNAVQAHCAKVTKTFETEMTDQSFKAAKGCFGRIAASLRDCADDLRAAAWPTEVRADIEKLARFTDAQAYSYDRGARMRSPDEYWELEAQEDDGSADIVRARLGLPTREG